MILVDTSVLIDFLKGRQNHKTTLLKEVIGRALPFGFSAFTFQEVLQGSRDETEFTDLLSYMSTQTVYFPKENLSAYERAARMYFDLQRRGVTVRSTIDLLIAITAIDNNLLLLHNDGDFDVMAQHLPTLKILTGF